MRLSIIINTSMISIAIMMMTSTCAPQTDDQEAVLRERLVRHYAQDDMAARAMNGEPLRLDITFIDLDGDGVPRAIVRLDHPAFCGSQGCAIDVVRFQDDHVAVIGAFIAHEAASRHDAMMQRRLIVIDRRAWTISGYRLIPLEP